MSEGDLYLEAFPRIEKRHRLCSEVSRDHKFSALAGRKWREHESDGGYERRENMVYPGVWAISFDVGLYHNTVPEGNRDGRTRTCCGAGAKEIG